MTAKPTLLIAGLRRSGTTALWEVLRSAPGLVAFDEPFHPRLWTGVRDNHKRTWGELTALWQVGPTDLVPGVTPIEPLDELKPGLSPDQTAYLVRLMGQDRPVVMDVVRHWNKLPALAAAGPNVHVVLLVRSPVPWVLSHLIPSGGEGWRFSLGTRFRRVMALQRQSGFDNWQYETILNTAIAKRHPVLESLAIEPDALARAPAYVKLLAFWWGANRHAYWALQRHGAGRHELLLAEDFMIDPATVAGRLMAPLNLNPKTLDFSSVHAPRRDPLGGADEWRRAFAQLEIPGTLLPTAKPDTTALRAAFDEGAL